MRTVTNEAQEKEIANRLGITKPNKPKEVAEFLARWEVYKETVSEFRADRLNSWGKFDLIEANAQAISKIRLSLNSIEAQAQTLEAMGETTRLAVTAYEQAQLDYERKIEAEADRPRREFESARGKFIEMLEKEERSLKYRKTRLENKAWSMPRDTAERLNLEEQARGAYDRLTVVQYLKQEARYMNEGEITQFTEEALIAHIDANSWQAKEILGKLANLANA